MTGTFFTKLTQMTERHQPVTQVDLAHLTLRIVPNESPLQGLDLGGCDPLKQLDNRLGLPHITPEELEMIHLAWNTF